jgi:hypothetical protein
MASIARQSPRIESAPKVINKNLIISLSLRAPNILSIFQDLEFDPIPAVTWHGNSEKHKNWTGHTSQDSTW